MPDSRVGCSRTPVASTGSTWPGSRSAGRNRPLAGAGLGITLAGTATATTRHRTRPDLQRKDPGPQTRSPDRGAASLHAISATVTGTGPGLSPAARLPPPSRSAPQPRRGSPTGLAGRTTGSRARHLSPAPAPTRSCVVSSETHSTPDHRTQPTLPADPSPSLRSLCALECSGWRRP